MRASIRELVIMVKQLNFSVFYRLCVALLLCILFANQANAQTGVHCNDDLMKFYKINIPHTKLYKNESPTVSSQLYCESVYKISGKYADKAESLLIKKYGMGKLAWENRVWSPEKGKKGTFRRSHPTADGSVATYLIHMDSEESVEKQRNKIDYFYITLAIYAL